MWNMYIMYVVAMACCTWFSPCLQSWATMWRSQTWSRGHTWLSLHIFENKCCTRIDALSTFHSDTSMRVQLWHNYCGCLRNTIGRCMCDFNCSSLIARVMCPTISGVQELILSSTTVFHFHAQQPTRVAPLFRSAIGYWPKILVSAIGIVY